jgi:hypothetical protein
MYNTLPKPNTLPHKQAAKFALLESTAKLIEDSKKRSDSSVPNSRDKALTVKAAGLSASSGYRAGPTDGPDPSPG